MFHLLKSQNFRVVFIFPLSFDLSQRVKPGLKDIFLKQKINFFNVQFGMAISSDSILSTLNDSAVRKFFWGSADRIHQLFRDNLGERVGGMLLSRLYGCGRCGDVRACV